jgi:hypothetical protein
MAPKRGKYFPKPPGLIRELKADLTRSVSFVVMAHKKRKEWAEQIAAEVGCEIVWDKYDDRHETGLRAIRAYNKDASHHCVIQDDVILAPNFRQNILDLVQYPEERCPIGLYYGSKGSAQSAHASAYDLAKRYKASWLVRKGPIWGPGIIYPTATITNLILHYRTSAVQNYDRRVMRYYQHEDKDCWYTIPSMVDHRVENNPSLSDHHLPNRQAKEFLGPQGDLVLRWDGPALRSET